jgi:hypothetical protein
MHFYKIYKSYPTSLDKLSIMPYNEDTEERRSEKNERFNST